MLVNKITGGQNTSDATATAYDISDGIIGYGKNGKIVGNSIVSPYSTASQMLENTNTITLQANDIEDAYLSYDADNNKYNLTNDSGYTYIDYIVSTGAQYIDTGFKPNQNTRVVMDLQLISTGGIPYVFGTWAGGLTNSYSVYWWTDVHNSWGVDYGTTRTAINQTNWDKRLIVDLNKNILTIDGIETTLASSTFTATNNLYLLALNNGSNVLDYTSAKLYSCKIYDNDTLIRDFRPVIFPSSKKVGLWDRVNKKIYYSASSTAFFSPEDYENLVIIPTQSNTLTYNGSAQSPTWNYDSSKMTISSAQATNAGTYTATATLKSGYKWPDGTTGAKTINWTIGKKGLSAYASPTYLHTYFNQQSDYCTVSTTDNVGVSYSTSSEYVGVSSFGPNQYRFSNLSGRYDFNGSITFTPYLPDTTNYYVARSAYVSLAFDRNY